MLDILSRIESLHRPALLVRTARFGIDDYSRTQHLGRILRVIDLPRPGAAILRLMEIEAEMNGARINRRADYSIAHHVEVLIALMGEARLLRATTRNLAEPS